MLIVRGKQIARKVKEKNSKKGMELVQVAILIGIAIGLGIIFKDQIGSFVSKTFDSLLGTSFS